MSRRYDAIVVGAGVNGLMIAHSLASEGLSKVLVVEQAVPGHGASSRGNGLLRTHHASPSEARLAIAGLRAYRSWDAHFGGSCGFQETGFLWIVGPEEVERLEHDIKIQRELGARVSFLDPAELHELQPHLSIAGVGGAAYEPESGCVRPSALIASLVEATQARGAEIATGARVDELVVAHDRIAGVIVNRELIETAVVVLAAGGWSAALAASAGVDLPVVARRIVTGAVFLPPTIANPIAFLDTTERLFFMPETAGAHVTVDDGGAPSGTVNPDTWDPRVPLELLSRGLERMSVRVPALRDAIPARTWAGVDGFSPDNRGIYGPVEDRAGLYLCVGASQKGLKVAPAVGRAIAETIVHANSTLDISAFALERFRDSAPIEQLAYANYNDLA